MFEPLAILLVLILAFYAMMMTVVLMMSRKNIILLEKIIRGLDVSETRNDMAIRNIANERVLENNRVVRVMGSIVDVLKQ